ncbi:hypothetical protein AB0C52_24980 [Streptomyces sp. NPDC048717]|uniref:hypothetical protein n=1 Tax=Streptomyces sp. NPDC048717 TaxID=3154928 RepID=UPI00342C40EA
MPPQFHFGLHPEFGVVARPTAAVTPHLAHWYLIREMFEPVPGKPHLYQLTYPDRDPERRGRQAVHDLRRRGFEVQADYKLDPDRSAPSAAPHQADGPAVRRARIARAAATRSTRFSTITSPIAVRMPEVSALDLAARRRSRS